MSIDARPSPARVSAAAAAAFPRWALFGLLAAYIAAGLIGRDPWYSDDLAGFGVMWTMAHGTAADWLLPNTVGLPLAEEGPLAFWLGALAIRTFGGLLGDATAARLACVAWFALATAALWYTTYRLARRDEAQPVAFVFGGEATARDYARMLGDVAVLLFIGTLGVVLRMHETTVESAAVALIATALYGLAWALDRPLAGALVAGTAIGALALARGPLPAVLLLVALAAALWIVQRDPVRRSALVVLAASAAVVCSLWPLAALALPADLRGAYFAEWRAWAWRSVGLPGAGELWWSVRNLAWAMWPLWPLAAWTLYAWRHSLRSPHVVVPALGAAAMLLALLLGEQSSRTYLSLVAAPLVVLAAFGATTLRRAAENVIDWFSIVIFSFFAFAVWAYYFAMLTGTPPKMAASVERLVPGFVTPAPLVPVALAAAACIAWIAFVGWRVLRHPPMLWRGPALAGGGLTMLWVVLVALFQPAVDYSRSFAPLARELRLRVAQVADPPHCIEAHRLTPAHRTAFAFHGALRFAPEAAGVDCPLALQRDSLRSELDNDPPSGDWQLVWEGRWPARPDEVLRLYRRAQG
jgi:4-amino-4-deoxy-L-arabinose transferase-like glycosyltransferase